MADDDFFIYEEEDFFSLESALRRLGRDTVHLYHHSEADPASFIRESKLIIEVLGVAGVCPSAFLLRKFDCLVEIGDKSHRVPITQSIAAPPSSGCGRNKKQKQQNTNKHTTAIPIPPGFPPWIFDEKKKHEAAEGYWDIIEYYGPTKISFKITSKSPIASTSLVGAKDITLEDIVFAQHRAELLEANINHSSSSSASVAAGAAAAASAAATGSPVGVRHGWGFVHSVAINTSSPYVCVDPTVSGGPSTTNKNKKWLLESAKSVSAASRNSPCSFSCLSSSSPPSSNCKCERGEKKREKQQHQQTKTGEVTIYFRARFVPLQACVTMAPTSLSRFLRRGGHRVHRHLPPGPAANRSTRTGSDDSSPSNRSGNNNNDDVLALVGNHGVLALVGDDESSELHRLAATGSAEIMRDIMISLAKKKVLKKALSLRSSSSDHRPLDAALAAGNHAVVKVLLERAGNLCFQDTRPGHSCALHYAVLGNNSACVRTLLRFLKKYCSSVVGWDTPFEAMLEWRDLWYDNSPLALVCGGGIAASTTTAANASSCNSSTVDFATGKISRISAIETTTNRVEILQLLIQAGADVAVTNRNNQRTPLMAACMSGSEDIVRELLTVKKPHSEGPQIPVIVYPSFPTTGTLGRGVDMGGAPPSSAAISPSASTRRGYSYNSNPSVLGAILTPRQNPLSLLKCKPCDRDHTGKTALMLAAEAGHETIVNTLISIGASYSDTDIDGCSALHLAAAAGHSSVCDVIGAAERSAWSAYRAHQMINSFSGLQPQGRLLLSKNILGKTAMDMARRNGHHDLAERLSTAAIEIYAATTSDTPSLPRDSSSSPKDKANVDDEWIVDEEAEEDEYKFALCSRGQPPVGYYGALRLQSEIVENDNNTANIAAANTAAVAVVDSST